MAALGNLQIDCSCGETLNVPMTVDPASYRPGDEPNTLTADLRIDHSFIAAHLATHDTVGGSDAR